MNKLFYYIFQLCILIALIQSILIFIYKHKNNIPNMNYWEFPMLLAILLESLFEKK